MALGRRGASQVLPWRSFLGLRLVPAGSLGVFFRIYTLPGSWACSFIFTWCPWGPGPPNLQELTWFHGPGTLWGLPGAPIGFFFGPGSFLAGSLLFSFLSERFSCGSGPSGLACFPSLPAPGYSVCPCWFGSGLTGFRHPTLAWRDSKGSHGIPKDCTAFRLSILAWRACAGVSLPGRAMLRLQAKPLWKKGLGSAPKEQSYRKYRARRARVPACHSQGGRRSGPKPSPYGKKVSEAHSKNSPIVSTARRARVWRRVTPMAGDAPGLKYIRKPICARRR